MAVIDRGTIVACGTMAELRDQAQAEESGLEGIFLRLTGGESERELMKVLAG